MSELEIKIIKFLLSASVFSENAIMKNFGIDKNTLENIFQNLTEKGYLENYDDFIKREKLNEDMDCCKSKASSSCGGGCSSCNSSNSCSSGSCCSNNIFSNIDDFSKIKVLTIKAVEKFG